MNTICPLCDSSATFSRSGKFKLYACQKCTNFYIDESAEDCLSGLVEVFKTEFRRKLSDLSRRKAEGTRFVIREAPAVDKSLPHIENVTPKINALIEDDSIDLA